jgi:hypothetical protein
LPDQENGTAASSSEADAKTATGKRNVPETKVLVGGKRKSEAVSSSPAVAVVVDLAKRRKLSEPVSAAASNSVRGASEKELELARAWFGALCGRERARMVWTMYGNPYDVWIDSAPTFCIERGRVIVVGTGRGVRSFSAPKRPPTLFSRRHAPAIPPPPATVKTPL